MYENIPFVAFGTDELKDNENVREFAICPNCGELHKVGYGDIIEKDGTKTPDNTLAFVHCNRNDETYLVGVGGKLIK